MNPLWHRLLPFFFLFLACKTSKMNESYLGERSLIQLKKDPVCEWLNGPLPSLDASVLEALRKKDPSRYSYKIYMGCWCEDSERLLPSFLALAREFNIPQKNIRFIALDADKRSPEKLEEADKVTFVPTFIVYDGDREIGRIVEIASPNLESVLLGIL